MVLELLKNVAVAFASLAGIGAGVYLAKKRGDVWMKNMDTARMLAEKEQAEKNEKAMEKAVEKIMEKTVERSLMKALDSGNFWRKLRKFEDDNPQHHRR